ncbi:hypothetical protein ACCT11_36465, partial [Rhizobium johnstonii]|uniref:hypothetical protein n=1 Tax=Rhizobium johnstonii TaxID=3019933 RepID=UPI003F9A9178
MTIKRTNRNHHPHQPKAVPILQKSNRKAFQIKTTPTTSTKLMQIQQKPKKRETTHLTTPLTRTPKPNSLNRHQPTRRR